MSKSHGRPCSSSVVMSRANPGMHLSSGSNFAVAVTLGGEYISATRRRAAFFFSLEYLVVDPPSCVTMLRISLLSSCSWPRCRTFRILSSSSKSSPVSLLSLPSSCCDCPLLQQSQAAQIHDHNSRIGRRQILTLPCPQSVTTFPTRAALEPAGVSLLASAPPVISTLAIRPPPMIDFRRWSARFDLVPL